MNETGHSTCPVWRNVALVVRKGEGAQWVFTLQDGPQGTSQVTQTGAGAHTEGPLGAPEL